jgi:undecaprenyl-diphosphatase
VDSLDRTIVVFINGFAHRSWTFDAFVRFLASDDLLKGMVVISVFYFVWFQFEEKPTELELTPKRQILIHTILVCMPGLLVTRLLAHFLPFRLRPLYNPDLHLRRAFTLDTNTLESWSSFPSDHAVLFFALATGVLLVHRKAGVCLYLYTTFFIALPRLFLGVHYPSDLLAGGLFGVALASSAKWPAFRSLLTRPALRLQERSPGIFYACFFFLTVQTAELYGSLRAAIGLSLRILLAWSNSLH